MTTFLAIDPGKTGAIAIFSDDTLRTFAGIDEIVELTEKFNWDFAVLEQVNGIPGQSAPAAFNFGRCYGEIRGVLNAYSIPIVDVTPQVWKGALGLKRTATDTQATLKAKSRALASEIFPAFASSFARAKDDGKAEAALIGHWYLTKGALRA